MTLIELHQKFFDFEREHSMFSIKTNENVYWWDLVRYQLFLKLNDDLILKNKLSIKAEKKTLSMSFYLLKRLLLDSIYLINSIFRKNYKYVFFISSRNKDASGYNIDNVSNDYLNILGEKSFIIESFFTAKTKYITYTNSYLVFNIKIGPKKRKHILNFDINKNLNIEFNTEIDFEKIVFDVLDTYHIEYFYYKKLLSILKPKKCFLIQKGVQKALIAAANDLLIDTIEIQHAQVNELHLAYSYPIEIDYKHLNSIPKKFFTQSGFWNNVKYPVSKKITMGTNQFALTSEPNSTKKNTIAIIFVDVYTEIFLELTKKLASKIADDNIIVKLHPYQKHQIPYVKNELKQFENIQIVYTEKNMLDIFSEVSSIVLIQSTAIYEALQSNIKVFVYKKQDYETHREVFHNKNVYLVDSEDEILKNYKNEFIKEKNVRFFEQFKTKKFLRFLSEDPN